MTPQERQLVDDLFDRLSKMESAARDPDATAAIAQGLRVAPNAIYPLVQTVLVQDEALRRANSRIQELEGQGAPQQDQGGGFLDSMRGAIFGQGQSQGSVPNVRPPDVGSRPVWNSGQVLQQSSPPHYDQGSYGQPYGGPQAPMGSGPRRRRLVSGNRGGGGGWRCWRITPAQQHPLDDGWKPPRLRRLECDGRPGHKPKPLDRSVQQQPRPRRRHQRHRFVRRSFAHRIVRFRVERSRAGRHGRPGRSGRHGRRR